MIPVYYPYLGKTSKQYAADAINSTWISSIGRYLQMAQERIQDLLGVKYCLLVNNGTSAQHLVVKCLQFRHPEITNIYVQDNVYVAAWNSLLFDQHFVLHPLSTNMNTWNYDLDLLNSKSREDYAILFTHNLGNVMDVTKFNNFVCIEDCCEGFLGKYGVHYAGTQSLASSISFFGNKNITCGEGGAFLTNDEELYQYAKCIHGQGQSIKRFVHQHMGYNYRMTNVAAAILLGQLESVNEIVELKSQVFNNYRSLLQHDRILFQIQESNTSPANWMFGIRIVGSPRYDVISKYMADHGVEVRPMFYPINAHPYMIDNEHVILGDHINASTLNHECVILPSFPTLTYNQQQYIANCILQFVASHSLIKRSNSAILLL